MSVKRDHVLLALSRLTHDRFSIVEIAGILALPENTVKGHFTRNGFKPAEKLARGKRVYDFATLQRYSLWLYMAPTSDGPIGYTAEQRDAILARIPIDTLWAAFAESAERFASLLIHEHNS